jgi:predicted HTH transcriptional regulator
MAVSFPRVEAALGGTSIAAADEETLQILVDGQVREDTEIEFKSATYGTSDRSRRDLAVDVAALANSLGGVIFLGVREEGGIAVELSPVPLDEGEEIRMRQILASRVAPPPQIEILRLELRDDPAHGYYLLAVRSAPGDLMLYESIRLCAIRAGMAHTSDTYRRRRSPTLTGTGSQQKPIKLSDSPRFA